MEAGAIALVGTTPDQIASAQQNLSEWLDRKMRDLAVERQDYETNLALAKKNKWRWNGFARGVNRTIARIRYYQKIQAAIKAGYLMVPNFPIDVFAIRKADAEFSAVKWTETAYRGQQPEQKADVLMLGEGEYVSNEAHESAASRAKRVKGEIVRNERGEVIYETVYTADSLQAVAFPVLGVKPQVVESLDRAMRHRIFDAFGLVGPRKQRDPIIVGRIIDPRSTRYHDRFVTFFVGWWLNVDDL